MKLKQTLITTALFLTLNATATLAAPLQDKMGGHKHADMNKTMKMEMKMEMEKLFDAVGVINSVDVENHKVNISHAAIKAIGWPKMTMDFKVSDAIDLSAFKAGDTIDFKIAKGSDGIFMIKSMKEKQ